MPFLMAYRGIIVIAKYRRDAYIHAPAYMPDGAALTRFTVPRANEEYIPACITRRLLSGY